MTTVGNALCGVQRETGGSLPAMPIARWTHGATDQRCQSQAATPNNPTVSRIKKASRAPIAAMPRKGTPEIQSAQRLQISRSSKATTNSRQKKSAVLTDVKNYKA